MESQILNFQIHKFINNFINLYSLFFCNVNTNDKRLIIIIANLFILLINFNTILIDLSRLPVLFNIEAMRRVFGTTETIIINDPNKHWEEKYKISCNNKPGDRVRYKWKNDEIRSGTVIYIDCSVNIKDFVTGSSRSVPLEK